jgi:hypothetical protein
MMTFVDKHEASDGCAAIPDFERVCYYMGQLLGPAEFRAEHDFFADKLALIVRRMIGHGVVCGLDVSYETPDADPCAPPGQDPLERTVITISPGMAVDCQGRLIVVRNELRLLLWSLLTVADRQSAVVINGGWRPPLYVSLSFDEADKENCRTLTSDGCSPMTRYQISRVRECFDVVVRLRPPTSSDCDECCAGCVDPAVLIAVIRQHADYCNLTGIEVDETVRRMLTRHHLTTIDGISWTHGAVYDIGAANAMLRTGIAVRFSRPVLVESLRDPLIVEVVVHAGGGGHRDAYLPRTVQVGPGVEDSGMTRELWIHDLGDDNLSTGDQVRIRIHCSFILDQCCRAVDGDHLGGRVPMYAPDYAPTGWVPHGTMATVLPSTVTPIDADHFDWISPCPYEEPDPPEPPPQHTPCMTSPRRRGPWTSGNGTEGGTFESWITIQGRKQP